MKALIAALTALVFATAAPAAMAFERPEVKVSPTTAKPGSTLTFSLPANQFCPAGDKIWLLGAIFRDAVGARTDPTGEYKGDVGFSTTAAADGSFSIKVKIKRNAHLTRGYSNFWIICNEKRLDGVTLKTQ